MSSNKRTRGKNVVRASRAPRQLPVTTGPPQWRAVASMYRSVRLGATANQTEVDVTVNNILCLQTMCTSANLVYSLAYAIRLKRVRIWFTSPTVATSISSTLEWNAGSTGFLLDGVSVAATTMSTTEPVCLDARPPTESLGGWYQAGPSGATNVLFSYSAPAGSVIQVDYDWVPNFTEAVYRSNATVATGTVGTLYCLGWASTVLALPPLNSIF